MTAFPDTPSTTNNLDADTDLLINARAELNDALDNLRLIILSANDANGVLCTNADNKIPFYHTIGAVDQTSLKDECITNEKLSDGCIGKDELADNAIEFRHLNCVNTTVDTSTTKLNTVTQAKDYVATKEPILTGSIFVTSTFTGVAEGTATGIQDVSTLGNGSNMVVVGAIFSHFGLSYDRYGTKSIGDTSEYSYWNNGGASGPSNRLVNFKLYYQKLEGQ